MIGKVPRSGSGFRGLVSYLMQGKKSQPDPNRVAWTSTRNLLVDDVDFAPRLMRAVAEQSRRCKKPVYHLVVSWSKDENPSDDLMQSIGATTLSDLNLHEHQAILIAHTDTAHKHLHMVVNRVHPATGKAWHASQDYKRLEQSIGRQAQALGLVFVPGRFNAPESARALPRRVRDSEYQAAVRHAAQPPPSKWSREEMVSRRAQILPLIKDARSWSQLAHWMDEAGLELRQKGQGLVISDGLGFMKLSDLGKQVRLAGLEAAFGERFAVFASQPRLKLQRKDAPVFVDTEGGAPARSDNGVGEGVLEARSNAVSAPEESSRRDDQGAADTPRQHPDGSHDEEAAADPEALSEDDKQRWREEAREARRARAPARKLNTAAADDGDAPVRRREAEPAVTPPSTENSMPDDPRAGAMATLSEAHQALSLLHAMSNTMGLVSREEIEKATREVARARAEVDRHQSASEWLADNVLEALTPTPPSRPESPAAQDDEEDVLAQKRLRDRNRTRDR